MWDKQTIDFGVVKQQSKRHGSFTYLGPRQIVKAETSCGCIAQVAIQHGRTINFNWTSDALPYHLDHLDVNRAISVTFHDGTSDFVQIKAKVVK